MKTLKKALCLVLAFVMVMGLGVSALADSNATGIELDESSVTLYLGTAKATAKLGATLRPTGATGDITWTSSNEKVVTVSSGTDNTEATIKAVAAGSATVTASVTGYGGKEYTATCSVTVASDALDSFTLLDSDKKSAGEINVGDELSLSAVAAYKSGVKVTTGFAFASSNYKVADVDDEGNVTGIKGGTAKITAEYAVGSSIEKAEYTVTVNNASTITVSRKDGESDKTMMAGETMALEAEVLDKDGKTAVYNDITWSSNNTAVASVDEDGVVTAKKAGTVTISAKTGAATGSFKISVTAQSLTGVSLDAKTLKVYPGGYGELTATVSPEGLPSSEYDVSWKSADETIAKVYQVSSSDNKNITIKGIAVGETTVTVTVTDKTDKTKKFTADCKVTVGALEDVNVTTEATVGTSISMSNIASTLKSKFSSYYDANIAADAAIKFTGITGAAYGTLYKGSSAVSSGSEYSFSDLSGMTFTPKTQGSWAADYTVTSGSMTMSGTITVKVSSASSVTVTVNLNSSDEYDFTSDETEDEISAYQAIVNAVYNKTRVSSFSIKFGTAPSSRYGVLYTSDSASTEVVANRTYTLASLKNFHFVPDTGSTYTRSFTAVNSSGTTLCEGTLKLVIGDGSSATVTVRLDNSKTYTFGDETEKDDSAVDLIYKAAGKTLSYIMFGSVKSGDDVGTLYADSDETKIKSRYEFYYDSDDVDEDDGDQYALEDVCFEPEKAGTYKVEFTAYTSKGKEILTGTIGIVVPKDGGSSDVKFDLGVNMLVNDDMDFDEDMFEEFFKNAKSSTYKLAYVTFDKIEGSGSFAGDDVDFDEDSKKYDSYKFYTSSYGGSTKNQEMLDDLTFSSPRTAGYTAIEFTCYGGTSSTSTNTKVSGVLYIFYTKGKVESVSYSVKSSSTTALDEDDFLSVYKKAMSSSSSTTKFSVVLMGIPSKGTLYYDYSSSKKGTALTSKNYNDYELFVNGGKSDDSVESITYVPSGSAGTYSVNYVAYSSAGTPLYIGTIEFKYGSSTLSSTISCGPEGYTFKLSDFYTSSDSDPVASLYFTQPSTGALYLNYANGRGTAVASSTKLYTIYATNGSYPVTSLTYIPKAGASGNVVINYTATTSSGKINTGSVTMAVSTKTSSSQFKDVTSSGVGSWAAASVDYAYKWGLVNGTAAGVFSPNDTMKRAQLVTILYRAAGSPSVTGISNAFKDVSSGAYYYNAVLWASKNGIVTGTSTTTFNPDGNVTREQVATFLYRFAKYTGMSVTNSGSLSGYTDYASVSSYAKDPMTWAVARGFITSTSTTSKVLSPTSTATRAQVAVMLHRFLTY